MSFGDAFSYPFKNKSKIFQIVLVFTILVVLLVANFISNRSNDSLLLLSFGIIIVQTLFLSGYGISVIRHIQKVDTYHFPAFDIMNDMGRGLAVIFAGIITMLPLVLFMFCGASLMTYTPSYGSASPSTILLVLLMIPFAVYLSWGLMVGMLRYAVEEHSGALFEFSRNFSIVNSNIGSAFSLLGYQILLGIIYYIVNNVVTFLYEVTLVDSITFRTDDTTLIVIVTIGTLLGITISLFQQFAGLHLLAQFGEKIGISGDYGDEKAKY